ncbi:MAG TPA: alpha-amylase family glycosyl hydrolase [Anaerolineae bacterium]|nr:alpha-amylase family glycosyl hydrolase [Anaerolineae bacterium]
MPRTAARTLSAGLALAVLAAACAPAPAPTPAPPTATPYPVWQPAPTPVPDLITPQWGREMVLYLVFVRSFADSDGDGIGDLRGLTDRLDYLNDGDPQTTTDLGVNALWLMPIFAAASYHGYDTVDHFRVNPDYGTREDLITLVQECHRRGIRVLPDYVMGAVSDQHPYFRDAYGNPASPYADWFTWYDEAHTRYKAFANIPSVPTPNGDNPAVQEYALQVARYWLDLDGDGDYTNGIDGLRCDWALAQSHAFWQRLRSELKALNPDLLLLGEVWSTAQDIGTYYRGQFDSTFDFPLYYVLAADPLATGRGVLNLVDPPGFVHGALLQRERYYPAGAQSVIFLNNHDTNRVMSSVQGDEGLARLAATLLFTLPGSPLVYYGEEIGMSGVKGNGQPYWDEYRREPMDWYAAESGPGMTTWFRPADRNNAANDGVSVEEQTNDPASLLANYRRLIRLRQNWPALSLGSYERVTVSEGPRSVYSYLRQDAAAQLLVVLNFTRESTAATLDLGATSLPPGPWTATDLLSNAALPSLAGGAYRLELPPLSGLVLHLERF